MIKNKKDLREYLEADRIALKRKHRTIKDRLAGVFFPDHIWIFQRRLRKTEYFSNQKSKGLLGRLQLFYHYYRYKKLAVKLGFSIPINVFGPGLAIVHIGTIVVNPQTRVGANCRIHVCVNIGTSAGSAKAPVIGDNVYIAPGAKIYGDIRIANNTAISANAAVNKSIEEEGKLIGGVPAKVIGDVDITKMIKHIKPAQA